MLRDHEYHVQCAISMPVAILIYLLFAVFASTMWPREVVAKGTRPPTHGWRLDGDMNWTFVGLIAGTPMIQVQEIVRARIVIASP